MSLVPISGHTFMPDPDLVRQDSDLYLDMGNTGENLAKIYNISRAEQNTLSHHCTLDAIKNNHFEEEIVPLKVKDTLYVNQNTNIVETTFKTDKCPRPDTIETLASLRPIFRQRGNCNCK